MAAALFNKVPIQGKKVVCLLSGGNIDVTILNRVIDRGLQTEGRLVKLTIELLDKPGQLEGVSSIIAGLGGNVISIYHDHADVNTDINSCLLSISMETKNHQHVEAIKTELTEHGFKIV